MLLLESALLLSKSTHDCRQPSHSQVQYQCTCITWKAQHSKTTRKVNPSWPNTNLNKLIQNLWYQLYPFVTPKVPINFNRYVYCPMMEPQLLDHTHPNSAWWANIMPLVAECHQSFLVTGSFAFTFRTSATSALPASWAAMPPASGWLAWHAG